MHINPYSIPPLISSIILVIFGFFVLKKNPRSALNISFAFICLACTIWLFFYFLAYNSTEEKLIVFLFKIGNFGVCFIPVTCIQYTVVFSKKNIRINIPSYVFGLTFCFLTLRTDYLIKGIHKYFWGYYPSVGPLHPYFLVFFVAFISYAFYLLVTYLKNGSRDTMKLNQAKYILAAFFIFNFASFDFLPKYGIEIYPFGYLPTILFLAIIAYAIVKHHLMDINIAIRRGFIYSILAAFITATYLIFVLLTEKLFQGVVGYQSLFVSILYAFLLAIFFIPLKNKIQRIADRLFLRQDPIQIAQENELLKQELEKSERLKAVASLAAGMAHEIKNPLTALKTFAEYLPKKINEPEFAQKFSKIVGHEVGRIDNLVHQLLEFARPSPLKIEEVDIHKLLDDTLEFLSNDLLKHNIKVVKEFSTNFHESKGTNYHESLGTNQRESDIRGNSSKIRGHSCLIKGDSNKLRQAFLNLFMNAIEAMPSGGTLTVSTSIRENQRGGKSAEIRIQDTGIGIPEKDLAHIFEPFHSTKEKGTGLGLSITYGIIKEHGGKIFVGSKVNEGTKFIIELPIMI